MNHNRKSSQPMQRRDDPTPEQIRERCREIRAEWSDSTRRRRAGRVQRPWTVPEVRQLRQLTASGTHPVSGTHPA